MATGQLLSIVRCSEQNKESNLLEIADEKIKNIRIN